MKTNMKIEKGEVIVLTQGEYSDFGIEGFIIALEDFDMSTEAQLHYKAQIAKGNDYDQTSDFAAHLITTEKAIPVRYRAIHLGNYLGFDKDFNIPREEE